MVAVTRKTSADYVCLPASYHARHFSRIRFFARLRSERLEQAKREEVRRKEEKSRSGRVVE